MASSHLKIIKEVVSMSDNLRRIMYRWLGAGPHEVMNAGADVLHRMQEAAESRLDMIEEDSEEHDEAAALVMRLVYKNRGITSAIEAKYAAEMDAIRFCGFMDRGKVDAALAKYRHDEPFKHIFEMSTELWNERDVMRRQSGVFTLRLFIELSKVLRCFEEEHPNATVYLSITPLREQISEWIKQTLPEVVAEQSVDMTSADVRKIMAQASEAGCLDD